MLNLVAYLVSEAVIICKMQNRNAALARMDIRLDLLLHCISTEDGLISNVVNYLAERMMDNTEYEFCSHIHFTTYLAFVALIYSNKMIVFNFQRRLGGYGASVSTAHVHEDSESHLLPRYFPSKQVRQRFKDNRLDGLSARLHEPFLINGSGGDTEAKGLEFQIPGIRTLCEKDGCSTSYIGAATTADVGILLDGKMLSRFQSI